MKIALLGQLRSGKTTAMNEMIEIGKEHFGIKIIANPLATPIYQEAKDFYARHGLVWKGKDRELLQAIGRALNEEYPLGDRIVELFDKSFDPELNQIVEDCRRITQANYLKEKGFYLVRVYASDKTRESRCKPGEYTSGHVTDIELIGYPVDFEIDNYDDNISRLHSQCFDIINQIRYTEILTIGDYYGR